MHTSVKWQNPRLITICPVQLCELVPEKLCDKLLRECSGGCKVRMLTVCGPRNSTLRRSIIPLRAAHDTVLLVRPGALPQRRSDL